MQPERILFVDDEMNLLSAIRRQFHREFDITTANGGAEGLALIESDGPFAVVVSDLRMPEMDGIQFLSSVRSASPNTVRMMLTGNADVSAAMQAVNEGNIFRFMSKPCPTETLRRAIMAGIEQFRLLTAERELIDNTLKGSVRLLTELLSTVNPIASGRATRVTRYVRQLVRLVSEKIPINDESRWQFEMSAMLSQVGAIPLPTVILKKASEGEALTEAEKELFDQHPAVGHKLLVNIPRLEPIAEVVAMQRLNFDGSNGTPSNPSRYDIPIVARVLKIALDFDELVMVGNSPTMALGILTESANWYDPDLLEALGRLVKLESRYTVGRVVARDLTSAMVLAENLVGADGNLLIAKGFELNDSIIQRLQHLAANGQLREPICVITPQASAPEVTPANRPAMANA